MTRTTLIMKSMKSVSTFTGFLSLGCSPKHKKNLITVQNRINQNTILNTNIPLYYHSYYLLQALIKINNSVYYKPMDCKTHLLYLDACDRAHKEYSDAINRRNEYLKETINNQLEYYAMQQM